MSLGYKAAAIAGIKANGMRWKYSIHDVKMHVDALNVIFEENVTTDNVEQIMSHTKAIAAAFQKFIDRSIPEDEQRYDELESIENLTENTPTYEIEEGTFNEWVEQYQYDMNVLYDMADYYRALVK